MIRNGSKELRARYLDVEAFESRGSQSKTMDNRNAPTGLVERAMKNLEAIERLASAGGDVHVVTQLVMSLLALIVFPKERTDKSAFRRALDLPLEELERRGWPTWTHISGEPIKLWELLEHLRHAISHGKVRFSSEARQYEAVRLTFTNRYNGTNWEGEIQARELRKFCDCLYGLLSRHG